MINLFSCLPKRWGVDHENISSGGHWSVEESKLHINVLELVATYHALQIYCKNMFDTLVHLKVENTTAVAWINKQTAPTELEFFNCETNLELCSIEKIRNLCLLYWVKKNKIPDCESRNVKGNLKRALKDHVFTKVRSTYDSLICIQGKQ